MRSRNFYPRLITTTGNVKKNRFARMFFLLGILLLGTSVTTIVNAQPTYASHGDAIGITVCANGTIDLSSLLLVNDPTAENVYWTAGATFYGGTIISSTATNSSLGGPSGMAQPITGAMIYTPAPGATQDFFTVYVGNIGFPSFNDQKNFLINIIPSPSVHVVDTNATICKGITSAKITFHNPQNVGPVDTVFHMTGGSTTFTVPANVHSLTFDVLGGAGGATDQVGTVNPGKGGRMQGTMTVNPTDVLTINVGGKGGNGSALGATPGYNGGGAANFYFFGCGGAGGGASDIHVNGTGLAQLRVSAGGGGGSGWDNTGTLYGGDGGGPIGSNGSNNAGLLHATGGTQSTGGSGSTYGGWTSGSNGGFLNGGAGSTQGISGGGGGGYYGGGGGVWNGGAGGSSYAYPGPGITVTNNVTGYNNTDGMVTLGYTVPGSTYDIVWHFDGTAIANGFRDTFLVNLPDSTFTIPVSTSALPGTYKGVLTIHNNDCSSAPINITVTINAVPVVTITTSTLSPTGTNQVVCNGQSTFDIDFSVAPGDAGAGVVWTNSNTSIDTNVVDPTRVLPPFGNALHIAAFLGYNLGNVAAIDTLTVTPTRLGCIGTTQVRTIKVNPTPRSNQTPTPGAICDQSTFTYTQGSFVSGASFAWSRAADGIGNAAASNSGPMIIDLLANNTALAHTVTYIDTIKANGCVNTSSITVTVYPTPLLSSTVTPSPICDSTLFRYLPTSGTPGVEFSWNRDPVVGISNPLASGADSVHEWLNNTTSSTVGVAYTYTLTLTVGTLVCQGAPETVIDSVYPSPTLSSASFIGNKCDSTEVKYVPRSSVTGATFIWNRYVVPGITNAAMVGADSLDEYLFNNTAHPVVDTYFITLSANGCNNIQPVTVNINPWAKLIGSLTQPAICDSTTFMYTPTSFTVGTSFIWNRDSINVFNRATFGSGAVSELLVNTTPNPIVDTYKYTMSAFGCPYHQNVLVTVNPKPLLNNLSTAPSSLCDSATFSYNPTSLTSPATFRWSRAYVPGIHEIAANGTNNPSEQLVNTTNVGVSAVYVYTVTAFGCSNTQDISVLVNPTPALTSATTASVCSGEPFSYTPTSFTPGATFAWVRTSVPHITPATASGTNGIHDTLTNDTLIPVNVIYKYRLGINSCLNGGTNNVTVTVKAKPPVPSVIIGPGHEVCAGVMYQNFGASDVVPVSYSWSAVNAQVWATGNTGQYAIVNFPNPGTAVITINSSLPNVGCITDNTYSVTVSPSVAETPQVIYYDGQFICLQTTEDSYQWGFDDAGSLDSTMLTGETNQNYSNTAPDFTTKRYWVMTSVGGCLQKTYYNVPTGVTDVKNISSIKVYPNPTSDNINVDINANIDGNIQVEVMNMLGQKVSTTTAVNHKATINVSSLPAGAYIIDCYREGVKLAAARFIKN